MNELEYKAVATEFKAVGDQGIYEGHFSIFGNVDDGGDVVHPGAFAKTIVERAKRVRIFYAHDWQKLIGPPPDILQEDATGLYAKGRLTLDSFWGKEAWALMKDGALTEGSIGYEPVKFDFENPANGRVADGMMALGLVRHLREVKLFEISPVPLGMNSMTQIQAVKMGLLRAAKAAIPPHATDKAPDDVAWDAAAVLRDAEGARQLRLIHAWVDPDGDPDSKTSYKLPHHLANGQVVWRGVAASGAAIMGSRGGVSIPEADVTGVKRHLERHYEQFDKMPPWAESAGLETYLETLQIITAELKEGRMLSSANKERIESAISAMRAALEALDTLLAAADPDAGKALQSALLRRARAAEYALMVGIRN